MENQPRMPEQPKTISPEEIDTAIKEKIDAVLKSREIEELSPKSYEMIKDAIMRDAPEQPMAQESFHAFLEGSENAIENMVLVRHETEATPSRTYLVDNSGVVVGHPENKEQARKIITEEREAER